MTLTLNSLDSTEIFQDPANLEACSADVYSRGVTACALLRPRTAERCAAALAELSLAGYHIIARGGGMSYTGGYLPVRERTVMLDTSALDAIVEINADDMYITVEAGVTWKRIYEALQPRGLRLPFFGTFSGAQATVGGGLSNGALFLGTARYGTGADAVLGLDVALADGSIVRTGQTGFAAASKPFYRTCGPDLSGLFLHDSGSLGVKLRATLRLIEAPKEIGHASFVFDNIEAAARALSAIGRSGAAEEAYVFDPETTRKNLRSEGLLSDANVLLNVVRSETSWWRGLKEGLTLVKAGRRFLPEQAYSLHVTCAARSLSALEADLETCRQAALKQGGSIIPNSIPKAVRANLFPPLDGVVGGEGERWAALNAKVAHSDAEKIIRASAERLAPYREQMKAQGVWMSHLLIAISNHAFSFEPVFHWHDEWLPVHQRYASDSIKQRLGTPPARPGARELVGKMRSELVALFAELGAASNQLGKTYPYRSVLRPETASLFTKLKNAVDPAGVMNPGALD